MGYECHNQEEYNLLYKHPRNAVTRDRNNSTGTNDQMKTRKSPHDIKSEAPSYKGGIIKS
jgi:hypothetical protein